MNFSHLLERKDAKNGRVLMMTRARDSIERGPRDGREVAMRVTMAEDSLDFDRSVCQIWCHYRCQHHCGMG